MSRECPLCGEPAERATRFAGIYYCGRHGEFEWFARELLHDADLIGIYQSYGYNRSLGRDFDRMKAAYVRGLRKRVTKYHPRTEGLSFLDVGCANGEYLQAARALDMKPVAGVEIDEEAKANAAAYGRVVSCLSDFQERFDVVQCKNVLSNIQDFQAFFVGLFERTKPGGVMFVDVLNQFGLVACVKKILGRPGLLRPPFVINGFSKLAIEELANKHRGRLAWLKTVSVGSDFLPYRRSPGLWIRGRIAQALGAASMLAADIVPLSPKETADTNDDRG